MTMAFATTEFRQWTPEVQQELFKLISQIQITKSRRNSVETTFMGAFETNMQGIEETLSLLSRWVLQAEEHCKSMISRPDFGYKSLAFVAMSDGKEFSLLPMLEGESEGETHRFTLAAAVILHLQMRDYILFATSDQGWQDWLNEEERLAAMPIEDLTRVEETNSIGYFETENQKGKTYYTSKQT